MTSNAERVLRASRALTARRKDELAAKLLKSVDEPNSEEIELLWAEEAEGRMKACLAGKMKLILWTEILAESRSRPRSLTLRKPREASIENCWTGTAPSGAVWETSSLTALKSASKSFNSTRSRIPK